MKILMVNKFHYIKGGSETYYFALKTLLEKNGHKVIDFSMKDSRNYESPYSKYFVDNIDYNAKQNIINKIKLGTKLIYSLEAKRKLEKLIQEEKPDIAHLHIFQHQISLSILDVLKKYNIPVVYTAHDLQMLCPNYQMLSKGKVCEKCKNNKYINCTINKCIKNSFAKSALGTIEGYFNKIYKKYDVIDKIITPSEFYRNKFIEFGVDENRVIHLTNFLERDKPDVNLIEEEYYLYFGRLSHEKGILTLVKAAIETNINLYIVGNGPIKNEIENIIKSNNAQNIKLLGFKKDQELIDIIGNSKAVILPSEWYENGPYSAIESLQLGRPIIGSDLGGIPELIKEGKNGFIFANGNINELKKSILKMENLNQNEYAEFVNNSLNVFEKKYMGKLHYNKLIKVYEALL